MFYFNNFSKKCKKKPLTALFCIIYRTTNAANQNHILCKVFFFHFHYFCNVCFQKTKTKTKYKLNESKYYAKSSWISSFYSFSLIFFFRFSPKNFIILANYSLNRFYLLQVVHGFLKQNLTRNCVHLFFICMNILFIIWNKSPTLGITNFNKKHFWQQL